MYTCDTFETRLLSTPSLTAGFNFSLHVCREMLLLNLHVICISCVTDVAVSSFTHFLVTLQTFVFQSSGGTVCFCSPAPAVCCDWTEYQDKYFSVPCPLYERYLYCFFFHKWYWSDNILLHCYKCV